MNEIERVVLERFKALLLERLPIRSLTLFGSRARGDAEPDSDVDVLVVLENTADEAARDYVSDCAWEAGYEHGIVVVPVVFGRDEWETGPERDSLLARAVEAEGVPL
jgi:uncharacterized protein